MSREKNYIVTKEQTSDQNDEVPLMSLSKESSIEDQQAELIAQLRSIVVQMEQTIEYNSEVLMEAIDGVIKLDGSQKILFCNKAIFKLFGYRPIDLLGKDISVLIPQYKENSRLFMNASDPNESHHATKPSYELEAIKRDGSKMYVELSVVEKTKGIPLEYAILIKDISAQPKNRDGRAELEPELETRFEEDDTVCIISELDLNGHITHINDLLCEVSQYTKEECIGQHHNMFLHKDMPEVFLQGLNAIISAGKTYRGVVKNSKKDGSAYWVDLVIAPILPANDGMPIKYISLQYVMSNFVQRQEEVDRLNEERNIHIRKINKLIEEKEVQARLFDKVNNQMEKFLYSTSHDLRSPITTIMGLVNLMRVDVVDEVVMDYISKIEISAKKLDRTIKDIMTYSISAYQHVESERIDFEPLVWEIWNSYSDEAAFDKIKMDVVVRGEGVFYIDSKRIQTILQKLIENSIHFYDDKKVSPFIRIMVVVGGEQIHLEIVDNGIGIGKSYLNDIFTMFFKASHISKGAGLGLFLVKEAVSQLQGSIKVESEIGFGSVFRIIIPNTHKGKLVHRKMLLMNAKSNGSQPTQ